MTTEGRTYDEWMALDFHVKKGEKATGRNRQGIATFNGNQVEENEEFNLTGLGCERDGGGD